MSFDDLFFLIIIPIAAVLATGVLMNFFWKSRLSRLATRFQRAMDAAETRLDRLQDSSEEEDDISKAREQLLYSWQDDLNEMLHPVFKVLGEPAEITEKQESKRLAESEQELFDQYLRRLQLLKRAKVRIKTRLKFTAGYIAQKTGDLAAAADYYQQAMELDQTSIEPRLNLARLLLWEQEYADAIKVFEELVELRGSDSQVYQGYGTALVHAGQLDDGIDALVTAIKLNPENPSAYTVLAEAHARSGNLARAREAVQVALKLKPRYYEARLMQQDLMIRDGDFEAAVRECEKFLNQKQDGHVYYNLARAHVLAGDVDTGLKALRTAFQLEDSLRFKSKDDRTFDELRENRRFKELQEGRLGLF